MLIMGRIRDWKKEKDFGLPGFVAAWGAFLWKKIYLFQELSLHSLECLRSGKSVADTKSAKDAD